MEPPVLLKEQASGMKPKGFARDGLWGGAVGGLICALIVISMKWLGYATTLLIRELRLKYAISLIEDNFGNITEICHEAGFRSLSYFGRSFKQYYGLSPKNYRESYKKNLQ